MQIDNYDFVKTCGACPEQYDVFDADGTQVAYVRLRWGCLTVKCPDVGGTEIYSADIGDGLTGSFESDQQRMYHLKEISERIDLLNRAADRYIELGFT